MSEEKEKNVNVNSEEIKSETKNTVNEVKETIKNVNIKDDAKKTTNFITSMFNKPLETLKKLANDGKNKNLKDALIVLIIWLVAILFTALFGHQWTWIMFKNRVLSIFKSLVAPVLGIVAMGLIIYLTQKENKKSLTTILTTVTIATTPLALVSVIGILKLISSNFSTVLTPITDFARALTIIYMFFAVKFVNGAEENSKSVKKFTVVQAIYFAVYFALTFLGIYIPML